MWVLPHFGPNFENLGPGAGWWWSTRIVSCSPIMYVTFYFLQNEKKLNTSSHIITDKIKKVKENLERFLREWVRKKMDIDLPNSANKRIVSFVEEWLKDAPYAMWN